MAASQSKQTDIACNLYIMNPELLICMFPTRVGWTHDYDADQQSVW